MLASDGYLSRIRFLNHHRQLPMCQGWVLWWICNGNFIRHVASTSLGIVLPVKGRLVGDSLTVSDSLLKLLLLNFLIISINEAQLKILRGYLTLRNYLRTTRMFLILPQGSGIAYYSRALKFNRVRVWSRLHRLDISIREIQHEIIILMWACTRLVDRLPILSVSLTWCGTLHIWYVLDYMSQIIGIVEVGLHIISAAGNRIFLNRNNHPRGYSLHSIARCLIHLIVDWTLLEGLIAHHVSHLSRMLIRGGLYIATSSCDVKLVVVAAELNRMSTATACVFQMHIDHALSDLTSSFAWHENYVSHLHIVLVVLLDSMRGY